MRPLAEFRHTNTRSFFSKVTEAAELEKGGGGAWGEGCCCVFIVQKGGRGLISRFFFQGRGWVIVEGCFGGCAKECAYSNKIVEI